MSASSDTTASSVSIPTPFPPQICSEPPGVPRGVTDRWPAHMVPQGAQYIPGPHATLPNPNLGAGFFWYTEGNSSYNALQVDVIASFQQRPAVPRELHLVEGFGYQFGPHRRAGQQSSADGPGRLTICTAIGGRPRTTFPIRPAFRAPTSCRSARASRGQQLRRVWKPAGERMAVQHDCFARERFSLHAADWIESIRRWRHQKSRSAFAQSRVLRTRGVRQSESSGSIPMRSFCLCRHVRELRAWRV
jgi:hypothetical protein